MQVLIDFQEVHNALGICQNIINYITTNSLEMQIEKAE